MTIHPIVLIALLAISAFVSGGSAAQVLIAVVAPNETPPPGTAYATNSIEDAIDFLSLNTVKTQERKLFISHGTFSINAIDLNSSFDSLVIEGTREQNTTLECAPAASFAININGARNISISYLNIRECWPTAALAVTSSTDITLSNLDLRANGVIGGAVVASASSNLRISMSNFSDNQAYRGGALYIINSDGITIEDCNFTNNTAFLSGGAAYFKETTAIVFRRCLFDSNRATASSAVAGAIHFQKSTGDIILATVRNNTAGAHGGGIAVTSQSMLSIHNATLFGNRALSRGGALFANDTSIVDPITGCDFLNNSASTGGAIALFFGQSTIRNSTIQLNSARVAGGGIWSDLQTKLELISSNVTLNMALIGMQMGCRNSCVWLDTTSGVCSATGTDRSFPSADDLASVSAQFETDNARGSYRGLTCDACHFFDQSASPCIPSNGSTCTEPQLGTCSWRSVSPWFWSRPQPAPRSEHIMLAWKSGFIIQGGTFSNETGTAQSTTYGKAVANRLAYSDVWFFDLVSQQWTRLDRNDVSSSAGVPIPRWRHAAVLYDENSFLIHGGACATTVSGCNSAGILSDVWQFDLVSGLWTRWNTTIDGPFNAIARQGHSMWIINSHIIIYGGALVDRGVWTLNDTSKRWSALQISSQSPRPRNRAGYGSDIAVDGTFMLYSGYSMQTPQDCFTQDVWQWNQTELSWSILSQASYPWDNINYRWADDSYGPDARAGHQLIRIAETNSLFLFGGQDAVGFKGNVWEFSLSSRCYARRANRFDTFAGPQSRYGPNSLLLRDKIYVFAGATESLGGTNDIWTFDYKISGFGDPIQCGTSSPSSFYVIGIIFAGAWMFLLGVWLFFRGKPPPPSDQDARMSRFERLQPNWMKPNLYFIPKNDRDFGDAFAKRSEAPMSMERRPNLLDKEEEDNDSDETSASPLFDSLPDEVVIRMMTFLKGSDLAALVASCRRMNSLGNDNVVWKSVVADYWEETPEFAALQQAAAASFSYKAFFIHGAAAFRRSKREGKMRAAVNVVHSTVPYYGIVFVFAIQIFLAGLKFDRVASFASASWALTLLPTMFLGCLSLSLCLLALAVRLRYRIGTAAMSGLSPSMRVTVRLVSRPAQLFFGFLVSTAFLLTPALISIRADAVAPISWWVALAPLMVFLACCCIVPGRLICSRRVSFIWLALGGPLFLLIKLILVAAKLEGAIEAEWCILFVPWWVSEVFFLCAAVGLCLFANKAVVGWVLSICSVVYITCMIVIRTLLCANLGSRDGCTTDGQPVSFPIGVIFVPLYLVLLLTFNGLIFVTNHLPPTSNSDSDGEMLDDVDELGFARKE
eukprot:TRINITY_DN6743_c0_g1_i1.p1 TRINITY_DN6743_c0_g1~~TRINITY_DN6743_c0_g1_i1.p1  ORF type:complete len:1327 (-),score=168.94 TRINITY_DN6743_c0_g1_i1:211-4191(-)